MNGDAHPVRPVASHDFDRNSCGARFVVELNLSFHSAVAGLIKDIARHDDGNEFLGMVDLALQTGPDLREGEDGACGGWVDEGRVGNVDVHGGGLYVC